MTTAIVTCEAQISGTRCRIAAGRISESMELPPRLVCQHHTRAMRFTTEHVDHALAPTWLLRRYYERLIQYAGHLRIRHGHAIREAETVRAVLRAARTQEGATP